MYLEKPHLFGTFSFGRGLPHFQLELRSRALTFRGRSNCPCLSNSSPSPGPDHVTKPPPIAPFPRATRFPLNLSLSFVNLIRDGGPVGACAQDPSQQPGDKSVCSGVLEFNSQLGA